jgi:hypothetical protein
MSSLKARAAAKKTPKLSGSYFNLLTPGNPKTIKGQKKGYFTFILHFAPANLSGYEVCANRTAVCTRLCLNIAGRGGIAKGGCLTMDLMAVGRTNSVQEARKRRTRLYFENRALFMALLVADINKAIAWCARHDFIPVFRLNGTSDIRWELASHEGRRLIADIFSEIQFYDYTKLTNRKNIPANYHLTFSAAEDNAAECEEWMAAGGNVAMVFRDKQTVARYIELDMDVFVGDDSDLRFLDPTGICALYAKGGVAKRDTGGFVRD